jgi:ATP-dependent Clp protease protease subunit
MSMPHDPRLPGEPASPPLGPPGVPGFPGVPIVPGVPGGPGDGGPFGGMRSRLYDQLLARRTVMLEGELGGEAATLVAAQLMALDADGDDKVTLLINSPGGPLDAAATVLDTMALLQVTVDTTVVGQAAGTAAIVLASGTGRRRIGPSAHVRLRLPDVAVSGDARRLAEDVAHHRRIQESLVARLAEATGQEPRLLARDLDRGRLLTAEEAVTYGLADEVTARPTRD